MKETGKMLDPTGAQDNEDCEVDGVEESEQYECFNPDDLIEKENSIPQQSIYRRVELLNKNDLKEKTPNAVQAARLKVGQYCPWYVFS